MSIYQPFLRLANARASLALAFLLTALPMLLMFAVLVPYGEVADEPAHALRALAILNGELLGHRQITVTGTLPRLAAGVDADPAILLAALTPVNGVTTVTALEMNDKRRQPWTRTRQFFAISPVAIYAPLFYLPAAAGLGIGCAAGLTPYQAAICGRLANILVYLSLGTAALMLARRAHLMLFGVLSVPMSLNLAASLNQDGLIIATSVLAAALLSRSWHDTADGSPQLAQPATWGAALALFCVALVKPPYLLLAGAFILPLDHWQLRQSAVMQRDLWRRAGLILLLCLGVSLWFAWIMVHISAPVYFAPRPVGPLLAGTFYSFIDHTAPMLQLHVLAATPWRFVTLPLHSFLVNPLQKEMIGVLGWLDVMLQPWLYILWFAAAAAALAATLLSPNPSLQRQPRLAGTLHTLLILALVFATFLAIYLSQYLDWTTPGANFIEGPQGRYLLPLVPFIGLAMPRLTFFGSTSIKSACTCLAIIPALAGLAALPELIVYSYYLR